MSFRDVRALTEHLRSLGYPSVISLESFRTPNFDLVADLLAWLVKSYDPHADIPLTIGSEDERVAFITAVAEFVATRAQVKLNPRKLYMADGTAVRELLKLVDLFNSANDALAADSDPADAALVKVGGGFMYHHGTGAGGGSADSRNRKPATSGGGGGMIGTSTPVSSAVVGDLSTKSATIRAARDLASDLTNRGATLYDMLATEAQSRAARSAALSKAIDLPSLRTAAQAALAAAQTEVSNLAQTVASMTTDATALAAKIEKKNAELERRNKRLKSMQGVRPAYMDEFERVEGELKGVYGKYVQAIRNLAWLESLVEESLRVEMDESEKCHSSAFSNASSKRSSTCCAVTWTGCWVPAATRAT
ncbi:Clusterin-associated protein-1-domain-containing protein [Catenaria anguillulae PL171]|uniref:Clusterin-associated protein-1-domain-containing protein n=1 Tax=Catenaria anguillulae PL171 TaxID=765915 RepID=A0A1Y2HG48_9FUNG|nr:Clusterin-associated protein-1-domain-containing protein [Catenaria anguillulae PL171]